MNIDTVIDDLSGLVDYLSNVPPDEMFDTDLADWRYRLEAAVECLHDIESTHGGRYDEDED